MAFEWRGAAWLPASRETRQAWWMALDSRVGALVGEWRIEESFGGEALLLHPA